MAKLVDARDLKSLGASRAGSTPAVRTNEPMFARMRDEAHLSPLRRRRPYKPLWSRRTERLAGAHSAPSAQSISSTAQVMFISIAHERPAAMKIFGPHFRRNWKNKGQMPVRAGTAPRGADDNSAGVSLRLCILHRNHTPRPAGPRQILQSLRNIVGLHIREVVIPRRLALRGKQAGDAAEKSLTFDRY